MRFFLFSFLLLGCFCAAAQIPDDIPTHDSFTLDSKVLDEPRVINVWTPLDYAQRNDSLFVVYMPDGGIQEDFPHVANTISRLIAAGDMPPVLLVGIENTQRRRDLTPPTSVASDKEIAPVVGGSQAFRDFIAEELMPEINKRYRSNGRKGIIGESLAGLFILETFLLQPDLFDGYIAIDPSLWWNDHALVRDAKQHLEKLPADKKYLWLAASKTKDIHPYVRQMAGILKEMSLPSLAWTYSYERKERHGTIYRAVKEKALKWLFREMRSY